MRRKGCYRGKRPLALIPDPDFAALDLRAEIAPILGLREEPFSRMSDAFPDRLSVNPKSPYYNEELLSKDVGIRFNGQEKTNVEEYCISEGWVRLAVGKTLDRKGDPLTLKVNGKVEPYFRSPKPAP